MWTFSPAAGFCCPTDVVIARQISPEAERRVVKIKDGIPDGFEGVDIGPETIQRYSKEIQKAAQFFGTAQWEFLNALLLIREQMPLQNISRFKRAATTIVGGGDSVAAVERTGIGRSDEPFVNRRRGDAGIY